MTWGFVFLILFLAGFSLALIGGLVRRMLHPYKLCDHVVVPSHEHWAAGRTPLFDFTVSFLTGFGAVALALYGLTTMSILEDVGIAVLAGLVIAFAVRAWLCRAVMPIGPSQAKENTARVVRRIPQDGFGQVEVEVSGCRVKLAARSESASDIDSGVFVRVIDRQESVVVVEPGEDEGGG